MPRTPVTFSEKIQWRILNDRREIIELAGDKLRMKAFAASHSNLIRIPATLWSGRDIADVLDIDWGTDWVLKPISGSGYAAFGSGSLRSSGIRPGDLRRWRQDEPEHRGEWAYEKAQRGYLLEERIPTPDGLPPNDLKVFVFDGQARFIYYSSPRSVAEAHRFYSTSWQPLEFRRDDVTLAEVVPPPPGLATAVKAAEEIGACYDFIRVDLFCTPDAVYFGELTPYPAGGLRRFTPQGADQVIGRMWDLATIDGGT